jgi:hypothetical protein
MASKNYCDSLKSDQNKFFDFFDAMHASIWLMFLPIFVYIGVFTLELFQLSCLITQSYYF